MSERQRWDQPHQLSRWGKGRWWEHQLCQLRPCRRRGPQWQLGARVSVMRSEAGAGGGLREVAPVRLQRGKGRAKSAWSKQVHGCMCQQLHRCMREDL